MCEGREGAYAGRIVRLKILAFVVAANAAACGPPQAPMDLDSLGRFLLREWPATDPTPVQDGLVNLAKILAPLDLIHGLGNRSWTLTPPAAEDLTEITWPMDRKLIDNLGGSVARQSQWPVIDHARLQVSADQLPIEPTAKTYVRHFVSPTDPSCFVDRTCLEIDTDNDIERANAVLSVVFSNHKRFRWFKVGDAWAIVARTWIDHSFDGSKGSLKQSYTLDIFMGRPDGTTWRYEAVWSETQISISADSGTQLAVVTTATDGAISTSDTVIGQRYHGMK